MSSPSDISWKSTDEAAIERDVIAALATANPDGSLTGDNIWRFDVYARVLAHKIAIAGVDGAYQRANLITTALRRPKLVQAREQQLLHEFRNRLSEITREHLRQPAEPWRVVLPLNIRGQGLGQFTRIQVQSLQMRRQTWQEVGRFCDLDDWWKWAREISGRENADALLRTEFTPVIAIVEAAGHQRAWEQGFRAFELLRVALNVQSVWARQTMQFGLPSPLGQVLPSPVYAVVPQSGDPTWYFSLTAYRYRPASRPPRIERARALLKRVDRIGSGDIQRMAIEALLKYGEALNTTDWRQAFLSLWQALEVIAVPSPDERSLSQAKNRIALLLGQEATDTDLLDVLSATRNRLVHAGIYPDEEGLQELQLLKRVFERSLNAFLSWGRTLRDVGSLETLYANLGSKETELAKRLRVIAAIRRRRRQTRQQPAAGQVHR